VQGYDEIQSGIIALLEAAQHTAARSINSLMTATYWEIGRRIAEFEQGGTERAAYGEALIQRLSKDLARRFGRGFSRQNLWQMRAFYRAWPGERICQTLSGKSIHPDIHRLRSPGLRARPTVQRPPGDVIELATLAKAFPPFVLEFLSLKDEYSESDLEDALIRRLADFLLELGDDFAFIGRQRRLRLDDTWFRIDLLFLHRRLRCLLVIDLLSGAPQKTSKSASSPTRTPGRCISILTTPVRIG
jgi:hypothetical protein